MPDPIRPTDLLSTEQIAELLAIHPKTLRAWARTKTVRHYRVGRVLRWRVAEVLEDIAVAAAS